MSGRKARKRAKKNISSQDRKRKLKITEVHGRKRTYFLNAWSKTNAETKITEIQNPSTP